MANWPLPERELKSTLNKQFKMNPFPLLLIFRIQEGMLSAQCLEHIVPLSLQYESNYKKGGGGGMYL